MKKYIIYGIFAILIIGLFGWTYVTYASRHTFYRTAAGALLIDKTDTFSSMLKGADAIAALGVRSDKWQKTELHIRTISKYEYTESAAYILHGEFPLFANPDARDKEIDRYAATVDSAVENINARRGGCSQSSIYAPLVSEINAVAKSGADIKVALAYTDGCENTPVFSIYRDGDKALLIHHPEKVRQLLSKHYGTPVDLHGVKIRFIYKPENDRENENFSLVMTGIYKPLLEGAGAEVSVQADQSYEP